MVSMVDIVETNAICRYRCAVSNGASESMGERHITFTFGGSSANARVTVIVILPTGSVPASVVVDDIKAQ